VRVKRVKDGDLKLIRIAEPDIKVDENVVEVHYQVIVGSKERQTMTEIHECHRMRYWFKPEVERMLIPTGFDLLGCLEWMSDRPAGSRSWNVCFIARKP